MEKEKIELLSPKIDVVFHSLFRESNNKLTEAFISDILGEKVRIIKNLDRHLDRKEAIEKQGIMDLRVEMEDKTKCNVEIQLKRQKNDCERFLYYLTDMYSRQLKIGEMYNSIYRCVSIVILDYELEELKNIKDVSTVFQMRDTKTGKIILTKKFELYIIELPKAKRKYLENLDDKVMQWSMFLNSPNSKEVDSIMEKNKHIKEAKTELESVSGDYEVRRLAELREKYIRDSHAEREYAIEEGLKEGMAKGMAKGMKEGLEKGLEKGLEQGIQQGLQQGTKESKINIAKNMLKRGMNVQDVVDITELTYNQVIKLKEEI